MSATLHHLPGDPDCTQLPAGAPCAGHELELTKPLSVVTDSGARASLVMRLRNATDGWTPPAEFWDALAQHVTPRMNPRDEQAATVRFLEVLDRVVPREAQT